MLRALTNAFGDWLRRQIEDRLLTQREFAERVGVTSVHVSRWVNGHVLPCGLNVVRIARVLDLTREQVETAMHRGKPMARSA
jgi:transcriptional regulator with XRE-family HTH domain